MPVFPGHLPVTVKNLMLDQRPLNSTRETRQSARFWGLEWPYRSVALWQKRDGLPPLSSMTRSYDPLCNRRPNRSRPGHHPRIALANGLVAAQDAQMMTASRSGQQDRLLSTAFCRMTDNDLGAIYTTTTSYTTTPSRHSGRPSRPWLNRF